MSETAKLILVAAQVFTMASAILVAFHPNILYAAIFLLFTFLGVATMFLYAGADFLAGVQLIVYVGGVTILVLFAIMLTSWLYQIKLRDFRARILTAVAVLGIALLPFLYTATEAIGRAVLSNPPKAFQEFAFSPKTQAIGDALLGPYLLPFEAVTVLLLGALVGAVWLARPTSQNPTGADK